MVWAQEVVLIEHKPLDNNCSNSLHKGLLSAVFMGSVVKIEYPLCLDRLTINLLL